MFKKVRNNETFERTFVQLPLISLFEIERIARVSTDQEIDR